MPAQQNQETHLNDEIYESQEVIDYSSDDSLYSEPKGLKNDLKHDTDIYDGPVKCQPPIFLCHIVFDLFSVILLTFIDFS